MLRVLPRLFWCGCFALCASLLALPGRAADPKVIRIGMMDSLSRGKSPRLREAFAPEFSQLLQEFTGLKSVVLAGLTPFTAAKQLEAGKWDLGIFQGVELAWVQPKHPRLKPMMIAVMGESDLRALVVVKKDSRFRHFKELKGRVAYLLFTSLPCRLFADKLAIRAREFFGKLYSAPSGEDALDHILEGKCEQLLWTHPRSIFTRP